MRSSHTDGLPVSLDHLRRMTDDTGLIEHAIGRIPRRQEGYSTDDNARALWLAYEWLHYARERGLEAEAADLARLIDIYFAFLAWVQKPDGWFHNNVSYDRRFELEVPSDDCQGRSVYALAVGMCEERDPARLTAYAQVLRRGLEAALRLTHARGVAHVVAAAARLLRHAEGVELPEDAAPEFWAFVRQRLPGVVERGARDLVSRFEAHARGDWPWFEDRMTYDNAVMPWALFEAYALTGEARWREVAEASLDGLLARMRAPEGWLRPIGNRGFAAPGFTAIWDQQPLEIAQLAIACESAWRATGDTAYRRLTAECQRWFYGENDKGVPMADPADGSCCDGLTPQGPNLNRGAESTWSYLITEIHVERAFADDLDAARAFGAWVGVPRQTLVSARSRRALGGFHR
ncbi:hypothetical protein [Alicyclobacillus acidocaldarius]|uniref:Glycosyltransferase n=1 Tax=Alicyclobacillus acidocaldarius subsp. acidocaldarius (strain ATCC 27009 / DSM 446 / BCRC 14685 / JCM 5260 / KCTC 1825 / NBRC 15652 / NCIMB 11725 / NRRL B-14509 / 104-IA) TaxID=521098 RepID=C8WU63_ALIAD|nr:hypothetical protein [Alicyclobacillus acidocaldarius]ACV57826.1 glycosyltransferase [Alicyclobacillus acidocaldarius subsp. acidocaldarius DSM 446]